MSASYLVQPVSGQSDSASKGVAVAVCLTFVNAGIAASFHVGSCSVWSGMSISAENFRYNLSPTPLVQHPRLYFHTSLDIPFGRPPWNVFHLESFPKPLEPLPWVHFQNPWTSLLESTLLIICCKVF